MVFCIYLFSMGTHLKQYQLLNSERQVFIIGTALLSIVDRLLTWRSVPIECPRHFIKQYSDIFMPKMHSMKIKTPTRIPSLPFPFCNTRLTITLHRKTAPEFFFIRPCNLCSNGYHSQGSSILMRVEHRNQIMASGSKASRTRKQPWELFLKIIIKPRKV